MHLLRINRKPSISHSGSTIHQSIVDAQNHLASGPYSNPTIHNTKLSQLRDVIPPRWFRDENILFPRWPINSPVGLIHGPGPCFKAE